MTNEEFQLLYWTSLERSLKRSPRPRPKPRHQPVVSARQKVALRQTRNTFKAGYQTVEQVMRNPTPVRDGTRGLTRNVGPHDIGGYLPGRSTH